MKNKTYFVTLLVSIVLTLGITVGEKSLPLFQQINLKGRDLYFQVRHAFFSSADKANEILLVIIDDETLKRLQQSWPFPRSVYVEAINRLKPYAPKAIGFDLIFSGKDLIPERDALFSAALKEAGNVVVAAYQSSVGEIGHESMTGENVLHIGIVDKPRDSDRVIRRAFLSFSIAGSVLPSWEAAIFEKAIGRPLSDLSLRGCNQSEAEAISNRDCFVALRAPRNNEFVIDYRLKPEEFSHISLWRLLEGSVLANELRQKIILIGPTAEVFHDFHATPLGLMPGLSVNANALTTLMQNQFFSEPPMSVWVLLLISFFSIWFVLLAGLMKPLKRGLLSLFFFIALYLITGFVMFLSYVLIDFWALSVSMILIFIGANLFQYGNLWFLDDQLKKASKQDLLTGFYTEKFLSLKLQMELKRHQNLTVLMIRSNELISSAGQILRMSVRKNELVCRFEDGFVILLPNTDLNDAKRLGEKITRGAQQSSQITFKTAAIYVADLRMIKSGWNSF